MGSKYTMTSAAAKRILVDWRLKMIDDPSGNNIRTLLQCIEAEGFSPGRNYISDLIREGDHMDEQCTSMLMFALADAYRFEASEHAQLKGALRTVLFSVEGTVREIMSDG